MVDKIDAYVEGRPIPRFSSSLISPASEYLCGGSVCFSVDWRVFSVRGSPILNSGKITSSPRAS